MAKSAAERQAAYRLRRNEGEGDKRLNAWITSSADFALDRLARYYGVTKRQMIERLASEADEAIHGKMELDSPEWDAYMDVALQPRVRNPE